MGVLPHRVRVGFGNPLARQSSQSTRSHAVPTAAGCEATRCRSTWITATPAASWRRSVCAARWSGAATTSRGAPAGFSWARATTPCAVDVARTASPSRRSPRSSDSRAVASSGSWRGDGGEDKAFVRATRTLPAHLLRIGRSPSPLACACPSRVPAANAARATERNRATCLGSHEPRTSAARSQFGLCCLCLRG